MLIFSFDLTCFSVYTHLIIAYESPLNLQIFLMGLLNPSWRTVYTLSIPLRFVFAVANSYIHPDEHFQSFEVITGKILGYSVQEPWEFTSDFPARSFGPLYLFYGPILNIVKWFNLSLTPFNIWYLIRLQNMIIGWLVVDYCLFLMLPTKQERLKAIFFTLTSYVTLVFQSHGFSNSIETILVLISIYIIDNLRFTFENKPLLHTESKMWNLFILGVVSAIGIFNRITFPVFIVLPSIFLFKYLWVKKLGVVPIATGFALTALSFILIDTFTFKHSLDTVWNNPLDYHSYVISPVNNLLYNSDYNNLSKHGIHPRFTYLLVHLPQLIGPTGLIFIVGNFKNRYYRTTPFLSLAGGIAILSLIPHQELRFLCPTIPLLCSCFDVVSSVGEPTNEEPVKETTKEEPNTEDEKKTKDETKTKGKSSSVLRTIYLNVWYLFNMTLAVIFGVAHQGGVVPALDHLRTTTAANSVNYQIWWRTYSPPTWILGDTTNSTQVLTRWDEGLSQALDKSKTNYVFDAMGADYSVVEELLRQIGQKADLKVSLITTESSFNYFNHSRSQDIKMNFNQTWSYDYHLDFDHLDIENSETWIAGLGIYELI